MKYIFNTIRGKLVLSFLILVLFLVSFFILYAYSREDLAIRSETVKRGQAVSLTFAQMVSTYIYELDYITILDNARELTAEGGIHSVSLADPDGTLLIDTRGRHGEKLPPDPFYEETVEKKEPLYRELTSKTEPATEFVTPIVSLNVTDYLLIIRISQKNAHERLNRATMKIMLISLIMIVLAAFIALILTNVLASPIKRLVKGTREIARGHLDCQIELNSTEEIRELARSFNLMGRNLKRQVEHLRRAEKKYRDIFENAVEGLFQITPNGYFISANVSLAEIIGYESPEELMAGQGSFFRCHAAPEDPERLKKMLLKKGRVFGFESQMIRTDGRKADVSISARAVNDGKGRLQYLTGSVVDITESRERKETQRSLEAADTANRIKNEFMARISHELRTPMNAILGFTGLLSGELLKPEHEGYVRQIDDSARKLMGIIDDILDFSEMEAGKMKLEAVPFSIADVMECIRRQFAEEASVRGLRLRMEMDEQTPQLFKGDPSRLGQILANLVSNAVKFTEKGEVVLRVETVKKTGAGARLRFAVRDTGIGIFPKKMESLFQPFTQAEDSLTRRYGGSGLGLVICKKLADMMGGEISAESVPGKGSVFSFTHFFETAPRDSAFLAPEAPSAEQEAVNPQPVRILIADDNPINLQVAEAMLSRLNVETGACRSGAEALAAFDAEVWDVILMDVRMPEMDGYETTRCIRGREAEKAGRGSGKKRVPIVAISGQSLPDENEKCLEAGMDDFLNKPFTPDQLFTCLKKWVPSVSKKKAGTSGPEIRPETEPESPRLPSELPGIEVESALGRLEGKRDLFRKLLADFRADFSGTAEKISAALENGAYEEAVRTAHSIKGVAANIGAEKLSETAAVLEKLFKEKQADVSGPFAAFQKDLDQVLASADQVSEPVSEPPEAASSADRERLRPMIEQLALLLAEGNADTAPLWEETKPLIHSAKAGTDITVMERQISDFEYEEALETLKRVARLIGIPLESDSA